MTQEDRGVINRVTGEISFRSGLRIQPHCSIGSLLLDSESKSRIQTHNLPLTGWNRHHLGSHTSEHGTFEVELLTAEGDRIYVVLLSHAHPFYERDTPQDADRRTFHEGVISTDLGGQKEHSWGEVLYRLATGENRDWLVVAYHRETGMPKTEKAVLLRLFAHEDLPDDAH